MQQYIANSFHLVTKLACYQNYVFSLLSLSIMPWIQSASYSE